MQRRLAVMIASFFALTTLYNNCGKETLVPLNSNLVGVYGYAQVDAHFCTSAPVYAQQAMKYLFIVDHSASNQPGIPPVPNDATNTDSSGARRFGPMINFVQSMVSIPNTTTAFDIIDFSTGATQAAGLTGFDSNSADFVTQATKDWVGTGTAQNPAPADGGFTDYEKALDEAYNLILQDLKNTAVQQGTTLNTNWYQIILITDGAPTVSTTAGLYTQTISDLNPVITSLLNLKTDPQYGQYVANISLNTAYYYNANSTPDATAVTLLQQMATTGNGLFLQFGGGQQILYQQFSPPVRNMQNQLVDVYIENSNSIWWDNGQIMQDTDGDGLPDMIETQMGSNPRAADSDGNGVSDLVEYRTKGAPCNSGTCSKAGRDPYAICDGYNPTVDANGNSVFSATSNDGLNDCEKYLLGGNSQTFNSSGNLVPDFLAFKNTIPIQPSKESVAFADPFGDGTNNYGKVKMGLPVQVSNRVLVGYSTRNSDLEVENVSTDPSVTCYHLNVQNIAMTAPDNAIKVYVVQNSSAVQDKPFLITAQGQLDRNASVTLQSGDFK